MIGAKYADFFRQNYNERYLILCGGRRSAKTWSTFQYLYGIASLCKVKVIVLTFSYDTLKATMEDFTNCLKLTIKERKTGYECLLNNGSFFQFNHCDKPTKALGTQCDILFVNESCNLPEDVFDTYDLGARHQVILNYNPTQVAWSDKLIENDNFLRTTFKDNPHLTDAQIRSFENLRIRAENPKASILDKYNYEVYYLGKTSSCSGLVFPNLEIISLNQFNEIPTEEFYGLDFGFSVDGDPTAMVAVKLYEDYIYARELFCEQGLIDNGELVDTIKSFGLDEDTPIFADYGGQGKSRMERIITDYDMSLYNARKRELFDNINDMVSYKGIKVCGDSLYQELNTMNLQKGKLICPKGDHCMDAMRYAFNTAKRSNR